MLDDLLVKRPGFSLQLIAAANAVDRVDAVIALAANDKALLELRCDAARTLGQLKTIKSVEALGTLAGGSPGSLQLYAVAALGKLVSNQPKDAVSTKALAALQSILTQPTANLDVKKAAVEALAGTQPGTVWLLDIAEKKQLPQELFADAGKLLRNSPYQGLRNKALLLFPAPGKLDPKKLPSISELAKRLGNVDKGKQVISASFKGETQCARCHTIRGAGGNIGPDLSMIGKKASKENLFESILLPSKAIADQYLQWQIETTAGQKILGLIVEENAAGVTIRDANGKDTKIAKGDIENRTKSLVSIMPEDIVKGFTEDDLIDVVEYLFTLKTASLTPESWHIAGPFANDADDKGLDTAYEPEKRVDLSAKYIGKSGEVKWKTVRHNGTGYFDLAAHHGGESVQSMSYLYQQIESPVDQDASILIGNDDGAKIWLNGEKVFENRDHFAATPERNKVTVKLKKGVNNVLLKIANGSNPHGFYLSVTSEQELKVAPAK